MIRFQNIYKSFGNLEVLKGVSHQINDGEVVTIIGPSGSGKSTLMNIIGLLDVSDTGKYYLDSKEVRKLSDDELSLFLIGSCVILKDTI